MPEDQRDIRAGRLVDLFLLQQYAVVEGKSGMKRVGGGNQRNPAKGQ
jgi:hypothetical protein